MIMSLLISSLSMCVSCCSKIFSDAELSIQRVNYTGSELRTDGYYFRQEAEYNQTLAMFLFRNGVVLSARAYGSLDLSIVESEMIQRYNTIRNDKMGWGVFLIADNQILIEQWNASTGHSLPIIKRKGYIENDTTFRIAETYYSDIEKTEYREFIWHFREFSPKPDSTNVFIK
jgi:hypothetical protein